MARKNRLGVVDPKLEILHQDIEEALSRLEARLPTDAERQRLRTVVRGFWEDYDELFWEKGEGQGVVGLLDNVLLAHGFIKDDLEFAMMVPIRMHSPEMGASHGKSHRKKRPKMGATKITESDLAAALRSGLGLPSDEAAMLWARDLKEAEGSPEAVAHLLELMNDELGGHGIRSIDMGWQGPYYGEIALLYIERGEDDVSTLMYDTAEQAFIVGPWGEWLAAGGEPSFEMGIATKGRFRVEVIADDSGKWVGNQLTFETREEAEAYAKDLASRWTLVSDWRVVEDKPSMGISRRERRPVTGPGYDMNLPSMPPFMYVEGHRKLGDLGVIAFGAYNAMGLIGTEGGGVAIVVEEPEKMVLATKTIPWDPPGRAAEAKEVADLIDEMMRTARRGRQQVRIFPANRKEDLVAMLQERGYGVRGFGG